MHNFVNNLVFFLFYINYISTEIRNQYTSFYKQVTKQHIRK
jgi:hypothetical protein